jgi:DNA-binding CsgD family transcriptional regulator
MEMIPQVLNESTRLSRREREVLELLQQGLTNRQIADRLCVSANTINKHVQQVLKKLGVRSRLLAVILAPARRPTLEEPIEDSRRNSVESIRAARIRRAEELDAQGRSAEAKDQWRLAALADRLPLEFQSESVNGAAC